MRFPRRRGTLLLTRGRLIKMSQERQKLSFFIVVIFLAVFGIIILAEVLSMEEGKNGGGGYGISYEHDALAANRRQSLSEEENWETPKPLRTSNNDKFENVKESKEYDEEQLKRHQKEMEILIRNLSMSMNIQPRAKSTDSSTEVNKNKKILSKVIPLNPVEKGTTLDHKNSNQNVSNAHDSIFGIDARWQNVEGIKNHKFFVYSAYYDARDTKKPVVRVIGVTRTKRSNKVMCRLYFDNKKINSHTSNSKLTNNTSSKDNGKHTQSFYDVPAGTFIIRENWNLKYSACFVTCPTKLPASSDTRETSVPESVSIFPAESSDPKITNTLPVINHNNGGTGTYEVNKTDVGVCVKPIHFHYNKTLELIEFIELNKILGVTKFTFYNHTMSDEVSCVLNYYTKQERTTSVMSWDLQVDSQTEIRTEGLFAALNDCLYRNMNDFRYLMLIDFDEFIIPHMNKTIPEMLEYLNSNQVLTKNGRKLNHPKLTSSYSFQNAFFYLQFGDDETADSSKDKQLASSLRVLRKTRRKNKFNPQKQRSKYICIPRQVKEAGNHFIWEFQQGSNINVPTNVGFLHHYRVCEFGGDDCINAPNQVDRTVHKYQDILQHNVKNVILKLSDQCKLDYLMLNSENDIDPVVSSSGEKYGDTEKFIVNREAALSHKNASLGSDTADNNKYGLNTG